MASRAPATIQLSEDNRTSSPIVQLEEDDAYLDTDEDVSSKEQTLPKKPWAVLAPYMSDRFSAYHLFEKKTTFGRHTSCDVVFSLKKCNLSTHEFENLSKHHFEIVRDCHHITRLIDNSMNGTYVDGKLVGRDNQFSLKHGQKIALSHPSYTCFTFFKFIPS